MPLTCFMVCFFIVENNYQGAKATHTAFTDYEGKFSDFSLTFKNLLCVLL